MNPAPGRKVIFALDVPTLDEANRFAALLSEKVAFFKVGLELFTAFGKDAVRCVKERGGRVFLDLKFHDIPNTVSHAAEEAVKLGVDMFNVHASSGSEMMRETAERCRNAAQKSGLPRPLVIAVTVLTSMDEPAIREVGLQGPLEERVVSLAVLAQEAGLDGVVASPKEIVPIRRRCGAEFLIVTPGIRPAFDRPKDDQKRVMTAREAVTAGASYLVIGRPVRLAPDPAAAMDEVLREIG
ncbi:MAG TPA: orotidine-5'-phosphate decarboxylase [Thermodesulfobacteriota bacterium]|nr:orotidine-5'-phosphate decarboxylase [Thermodesulfobacteriota bacterium]